MKYYSIRVVEADEHDILNAIAKVQQGEFLDDDELCDKVLTADEIKEIFNKL